MPRRRSEERRILGPYPEDDEWRIVVLNPKATPRRSSFKAPTKAKIDELVEDILDGWAELDEITVESALDQYKRARMRNGTTEASIKETVRRIRLMFTDGSRLVSDLDEKYCRGSYDALVDKGYPSATHRHILIQSRSWLRWCADDKKWIRENPLVKVKPLGPKPNKGKSQHTGTEAKRLNAWLRWRATKLDHAAIGCLMLQTMALRQGDVVRRRVLEVDLNGTVLIVADGKTEKSNRRRAVPKFLQPILRAIVTGRAPLEPLFPADGGGFHTKSWLRLAMVRFCRDAGVRYVCPHSLKGTAGTVASVVGKTADEVADFLSHEDVKTQTHYVDESAAADARQRDQEGFWETEGEA